MAAQPSIVGKRSVLVIDIQKSAFMEVKAGTPVWKITRENMERARRVVDAAHENGLPVIIIRDPPPQIWSITAANSTARRNPLMEGGPARP